MIYGKQKLSLYDNKAALDSKEETRMSLQAVAYINKTVCYNIVNIMFHKSTGSIHEGSMSLFVLWLTFVFTPSGGSPVEDGCSLIDRSTVRDPAAAYK